MGEAGGKDLAHIDICLNKDPTYGHRIDNPGDYNWCTVEHKPWDVILFAGIAVVVSCLAMGPFASLIVLVAGGVLMGFAYPFNLRELGNGIALWLGIEPYELFFYIFLPPLLLDAALKIDWYAFKKVMLNVVTLAFLVVMGTCAILIPVLLYMFWLKPQGWQWYDAALFGSMIASTDAVAIIAVLKKCGGPERLRIVLEGESLLNDASSITLFIIFIEFVIDAAEGKPNNSSAGNIIGEIVKQMIWLAVGGGLIGLAFGIATRYTLRILQRFGASFEQQIALTLACGYLSFYVANAPASKSGVIAVAVFGLYGAATSKFDISSRLEESGTFDGFWDSFAFVANGIVFFFAGASSVNFVIRSANSLGGYNRDDLFSSLWRAPLVWMVLNILRFLIISLFKPLFWVGKAPLTFRDVIFLSASGLRGSVSLILAQAVVTEVPQSVNPERQKVQSEVVLFTAVFVLLTLLVNAPMLPYVLKWTKLDKVPPQHQKMRRKALRLLIRETEASIEELRDDADDMLRGVDWATVHKYVDVSKKLESFVNPHQKRSRSRPRAWLVAVCCCWRRRPKTALPSTIMQDDVEMATAGSVGKLGNCDSVVTTTDASDSAWKLSSHDELGHGKSSRVADSSDSRRSISDFDDNEFEGEVPFLNHNSAGKARRELVGDPASADGLPTHFVRPRIRSADMERKDSHHSERSNVPLRPESHTTSSFTAFDTGASRHCSSTAERSQDRHSMSQGLQLPVSTLELDVVYCGDDSALEDSILPGNPDNDASSPSRATAAAALGHTSSSIPDLSAESPERQRASEMLAASTSPAAPAPRGSLGASIDEHEPYPQAFDPLVGISSQGTIKGPSKSAHRSLADLFGGGGIGSGSRAVPLGDTRTSLSSLFASAPAHLETTAESREPDGAASPAEAAADGSQSHTSRQQDASSMPTTRDSPAAAWTSSQPSHVLLAQPSSAPPEINADAGAGSRDGWKAAADVSSIASGSLRVGDAAAPLACRPAPSGANAATGPPKEDRRSSLSGLVRRRQHQKSEPRHSGYEDAEAGGNEAGDADEARHRAAIENSHYSTSEFVCEAPLQRHGFRAKRTEALNNKSAMVEVGGTSAPVFGTSAAVLHPEPPHGSEGPSNAWNEVNLPHGGNAPDIAPLGSSTNVQTGENSVAALLSSREASSAQHTWHTGVLAKRTAIMSPIAGTPTSTFNRGSMGRTSQHSREPNNGELPQPEEEEVADMRARIYAGMKRYFHTKSNTGLLSHRGLRILDHCCDLQIDDPRTPLALWNGVESEVTGGWAQSLLVKLVFKLRRFGIKLKRSEWRVLRWLLARPAAWVVTFGQRLLSKQLLLSCEVAMEYLLALTNSPQVHWLHENEGSTALMKEIDAESKRVWKFVIDREIEAPERFRAIQSYRAAMAVLRQQEVLVERMVHTGMVTPQEAALMGAPIEEAARRLVHRGPVWRAPLVIDVLRSLPIMRDVPVKVLEQVLATGRLIMYRSDRQIHESAPNEGIFIVVSGLVRVRYDVWQGTHQTYFLGTGGIFGLFSALTGESLEGRAVAIAEGNALGKGPVVFELPLSGVELIRRCAAEGDPVFMQLEVDMFRLAALYVLERMESQLLGQLYTALSVHRLVMKREDDSAPSRGDSPDAAALRLQSLFRPPSLEDGLTGGGGGGSSKPSPLRVPGAAKPPALSRRSTSVAHQAPGPRAATTNSFLGGRHSMAWMLEAANGEDTVAAPQARHSSAGIREEAKSVAQAATRAAEAAADQRSIQRQAEDVSNALRLQLWGAELVELAPGSSLGFRCSVVVLRGAVTLTTTPAAALTQSRRASTAGRHIGTPDGSPQATRYAAPAVVPWVWDVETQDGPNIDSDSEDAAPTTDAATARRLEVSVEGQLEAGADGATLVLASDDDSLLEELLSQLPLQSPPDAAIIRQPSEQPLSPSSGGEKRRASATGPRGLACAVRSLVGKSSKGAPLTAGTSAAAAPAEGTPLDSSDSNAQSHSYDPLSSPTTTTLSPSGSDSHSSSARSGSASSVSAPDETAGTKGKQQAWRAAMTAGGLAARRSLRRLSGEGASTGELHPPRSRAAFAHQADRNAM